jgi:hemoglobin/transferrin/lactoferrin receptor protein
MRYIVLFPLLTLVPLVAQDKPEEEPIPLEEIIVTATRREAEVFEVPYTAHIITQQDIQMRKISRTMPEIFSEEPSIMVQKTSYGQGSPFIRGFTGFRTLFLIDGIRLNNSVFRDGPNQYWNTVDPLTVSRLEVVKGPSSVLYGSDAIGGTVNAITRGRESYEEGFNWDRRIYGNYSSASDSGIVRVELSGNLGEVFGGLLGGSLKDFNDLEGGRHTGLQPKTGYGEMDWDLKMEYRFLPDSRLVLAYQHVGQEDIWRTHKTIYGISWHRTSIGSERKRVLDQGRDLIYLQYHGKDLRTFFNRADASLSYHLQQEKQFRIKGNGKRDIQGFKVKTLGFWTQFGSSTPIGHFTYGIEYYRDRVDSYREKYRADGTLEKVEIQGPVADNATYDLGGIFVQDEIPITGKLGVTVGLRYTHAEAKAKGVKDPRTEDQISISDSWGNLTGSLRFLYRIRKGWNIFSGVSQGFRAPNLSDLSRFDTARTDEIETPSPGLDPEEFIAYEIGIKASQGHLRGQLSCFYTSIDDMIVRYPTGNIVEGDYEVQKANVGDGFIYGVELEAKTDLSDEWSLFGGFAWQSGEVDTYPTSVPLKQREPISRVPPLAGMIGVGWCSPSGRYWAEGIITMVDDQDRLSPRDKRDTQRIPPGGTPGYTVYELRGGIKLKEGLSISAVIENITNKDYRIHGSGQNEPGTNLILSVDLVF